LHHGVLLYIIIFLTGEQPDWPSELQDRSTVAEGLLKIGVTDATALEFEFTDAQLEHLTKALNAPVCEFVGFILPCLSSIFIIHSYSHFVFYFHDFA
jgi:hypothetical protein